jgi:Carboxypeptidase regulatory-like domain
MRRSVRSQIATIGFVLAGTPAALAAQATLRGRVVADSARAPVVGAQVTVVRGEPLASTDSTGRFRLAGLRQGDVLVVVRALGFRAETTLVELDVDEFEMRDIRLTRQAQELAGVTVAGEKARSLADRLSGFDERRKMGIGTFIDRQMLEKFANRRTADVLQATAPGTSLKHGTGLKAWVATGRDQTSGHGAFQGGGCLTLLDRADCQAGARPACYMDVYLDGALVYNSGNRDKAPLFDINSVAPESIESLEVYAGASQVPAMYSRTGSNCGVLLIWTRSSR